MVGLRKIVRRCKTGQLPEPVDQKYVEDWLIPWVIPAALTTQIDGILPYIFI